MCIDRSAALKRKARRWREVTFLVIASARFARHFFHESKSSDVPPRETTMLLAATAASAGSSSVLYEKSAA